MLVKDYMKLVYKAKNDGGLSKIAITFMVKHDLKENAEKSEQELILISQHLSNKDKRIEVVSILLGQLSVSPKPNVGQWRTKSYKQVARELHPDSDTGDTESFQFLQEVKEFLWDYSGQPRKIIDKVTWSLEKEFANGTYNKYDKYKK
ncbi:MAG: hypothetical protein ACRCZ0_06970 [Cetobacterium sp.]